MDCYLSKRDLHESNDDLPPALAERFSKKRLRLARDQEHESVANTLLEDIERLQDDDGAMLQKLLADCVHLQYWSRPGAGSDTEDGSTVLAKYLWKGGHEAFRKSRVCLTAGLLKLAPLVESGEREARRAAPAEVVWPVEEQTGLLGKPAHFDVAPFEGWTPGVDA